VVLTDHDTSSEVEQLECSVHPLSAESTSMDVVSLLCCTTASTQTLQE